MKMVWNTRGWKLSLILTNTIVSRTRACLGSGVHDMCDMCVCNLRPPAAPARAPRVNCDFCILGKGRLINEKCQNEPHSALRATVRV